VRDFGEGRALELEFSRSPAGVRGEWKIRRDPTELRRYRERSGSKLNGRLGGAAGLYLPPGGRKRG